MLILLAIMVASWFSLVAGVVLLILVCLIKSPRVALSHVVTLLVISGVILAPSIIKYAATEWKVAGLVAVGFHPLLETSFYHQRVVAFGQNLLLIATVGGVIGYLLRSVMLRLDNRVTAALKDYLIKLDARDAEIMRRNDLEMKMRKEQAQQTSYVKCPKCGSDNLVSGKFGVCQYCRSKIENHRYK